MFSSQLINLNGIEMCTFCVQIIFIITINTDFFSACIQIFFYKYYYEQKPIAYFGVQNDVFMLCDFIRWVQSCAGMVVQQ